MGLRDDLIEAKAQAALAAGADPDDINIDEGSAIYIEADLMTDAIVNFLTEADFTITQLKAPVVVEKMKTPDLPVNIELKTLLGDKAPILDILKKIPGGKELVGELEGKLQKAVLPLLEGGAKLAGLDLGKDSGGLESTGYVFIGVDPDSQEQFSVEDEDGQREYTTVKLFAEDIEEFK